MGGTGSRCDPHHKHRPQHYPYSIAAGDWHVSWRAVDALDAADLARELARVQQALVGYGLLHRLTIQTTSGREEL